MWYGSDVVLTDLNRKKRVQTSPKLKVGKETLSPEPDSPSHWTVENIYDGGGLRQLPIMPRANLPMTYTGGSFTYFCFYTEDEYLGSILYLDEISPKIWYICRPGHRQQFEDYWCQPIFTMDYLNDFNAGGRKIVTENCILFSPCLPKGHKVPLPFYRITQRGEMFMVLAPRAYHGGLNEGYNISSSGNYAGSTWLWCAMTTIKTRTSSHLVADVNLPTELMLWPYFVTRFSWFVERGGGSSVAVLHKPFGPGVSKLMKQW